jgi:hypothetical protein
MKGVPRGHTWRHILWTAALFMSLLVRADDVLQQGMLLKVIFVLRVVAVFDVTRRNCVLAAFPFGGKRDDFLDVGEC